MKIVVTQHGDLKKTEKFLKKMESGDYTKILSKYGEQGVQALASATPKETGKTAASWTYDIVASNGVYEIVFSNTNINKGVNIAIILQYGHGTRTGGYVTGIDYINPAIKPVFEEMANAAWKEVNS